VTDPRRNRNQPNRPKQPPRPVIQFGIMGTTVPSPYASKTVFEPRVFDRQSLVGTLTQRGLDKNSAPPLPESYLQRVQKNLKAIFDEGRFSSSRILVDAKDGELLVAFPFNQTTVERFKGLDKNERAWDPDAKCWRVFPAAFDDVFDALGRGFRMTDAAYELLLEFVRGPYYAHIGRTKLGKLIVREAWFEEIKMANLPDGAALFRSSAHAKGEAFVPPSMGVEDIQAMVAGFSFARKPYAHQFLGIEFLIANAEAALLDEMGCGKSFQIASAGSILLNRKDIDAMLIVAPMSLLRTWQEELRMAGVDDFSIVVGTQAQRKKALASQARVFVVHYEGLRLEAEALAAWMKERKVMLVFDESQRIKNMQAQTTKAAQLVRPNAARCVIATGTPIANRPLDLFSQYLVMDTGRTFGTKFGAFKNTFCDIEIQKIRVGRRLIPVEKFIGVRNGPELHSRILRTSLRRLKSEVLDLPPVIYKDYVVELTGEQKTIYQQMRDNLKMEINGMSNQELRAAQNSVLVKLLRLGQIASNPGLVAPDLAKKGVKFAELDQVLEDVMADDTKKVILWSHFVENVAALVERYEEPYGAVGHTGDLGVDERQTSVNRFRDDVSCRLFVATPQSAKEGLTLLPRDGRMVADTMIYVDLSFDSASYIQSQARFHRIGQDAARCLVIHMIAEGTVDEYIRKTIIEKIRTATQVLDDKDSVDGIVASTRMEFTRDEILKAL
jgi:SWI/SNF-related matrix-associated actin-dependent regulator 1 of chromatin subfamily A